MHVECPVPQFQVHANTSAAEWISSIRSYDPELYCGYQTASYTLQGGSEDARYYPFSSLTDFHTYWWVMTAFRSFVFFLLALYLVLQRYEWVQSHTISMVGITTWLTGLTLIILIPAWNGRTTQSCFQFQNTEFLLDWSFGWMVWTWGNVQTIQRYFQDLHKNRFIGITLLMWIWARQTFWMNWNNTSPLVEYATMSVLSYLVVWVVIMLLCESDLCYPILGCIAVAVLWWTPQHVNDHFPYIQVTDDYNPWRITMWLGLSTLIIMAAIGFVFMVDGLCEIVRQKQSLWRQHREEPTDPPLSRRTLFQPAWHPPTYLTGGSHVDIAYSRLGHTTN